MTITKFLKKHLILLTLAGAVAILLVIVGAFLLGSKYALDHTNISDITPTQAAEAMKNDHFWQSYREDTFRMSGQISSISNTNNDLVITFKTNSSYITSCSFGASKQTLLVGQNITILTEAQQAERQTSGVLLHNCLTI